MTLILFPLRLECEKFKSHLESFGYTLEGGKVGAVNYYVAQDLGWTLAVGGLGKTQFAITTQFLIDKLPLVNSVLCVGAAGALSEEIKPADIVVGESTIEHDFLSSNKNEVPIFIADPKLLEDLKSPNCVRRGHDNYGASDRGKFFVHFGVIASGDEDIVDSKRALELRSRTQALAVAWEGAGGARACKFNSMPFIEIRGITDLANHNTYDDFKHNIDLAMKNICDFLLGKL